MAFICKVESHDPDVPAPSWSSDTLRPSAEFVISHDRAGNVLSTFGDVVWDLSPYARQLCRLTFRASDPVGTPAGAVAETNRQLFKRVCFYFMYGPRKPISPKTAHVMYDTFKRVVDHANEQGVVLTQLARFDRVVGSLRQKITPAYARNLPRILNELYAARSSLGFTILTYDQIDDLRLALPRADVQQTPYIPQRIYLYHLRRCKQLVEDYLQNESEFTSLFNRCLKEYIKVRGAGGLFDTAKKGAKANPFNPASPNFIGWTFPELAAHYGVDEVIRRWLLEPGSSRADYTISTFSKYLSAVQFVADLVLISYSGMRADESSALRVNCLEVERDELLGEIYMLVGPTTKTDPDNDARWITSISAKAAVDAMTSITTLRLSAGRLNPRMSRHDLSLKGARLYSRGFEPWCPAARADADPDRRVHRTMDGWRSRCPGLYDPSELVITHADWEEAVALTPSLDPSKFNVGETWTFGYHQLRRTLVCNAAASEVVSFPAAQYQFKHLHEAMTRYYARNYSALRVNESIRRDYADEVLDAVVRDALNLSSDRFVSPYGEEHKQAILRFVTESDEAELKRKAKRGDLHVRRNSLGICLYAGECEFGGIDSVAQCVDCSDVLVDAHRRQKIEFILGKLEDETFATNEEDGPDAASQHAQVRAMKKVLNVVLI